MHQAVAGPSRPCQNLHKELSKDDLDLLPVRAAANRLDAPHSAPSVARHAAPVSQMPSPTPKQAKSHAMPSRKGKERAADPAVPESFMKRLAGPSTGKAGLLRDPAEVRQIIYDASKDSAFFKNEQKRDAATTLQVNAMLAKLEARLSALGGNLTNEEREVDNKIARLESSRHLDETCVVIDADAFYASVEELDNPSLIGKAFGVGSGVLTTASYEARKYGCRSAMAGFVAKKLCPHLIFVKPDFTKYSAASNKIMDVLRRYDPNMAPASLDEAYLNITAFLKQTGRTSADVVSEMRAAVKQETGLTMSAGVGPNKTVAKIAADINKPDGQCVVASIREAVMAFLHPLPVRKVPGIGRVNERWLDALGVVTIGDIYKERGKLSLVMSTDWLLSAYLGLGSSKVEPGKRESRKSVGCETTFSTLYREEDLYEKLRECADSLAGDLARTQFSGRTITLKLKLDTYELLSRAHTSGSNKYFSTADDLYKIGKALLEKELSSRYKDFDSGKKVVGSNGCRELRLRLMGLRANNLRDESEQAQKQRGSKASLDSWAKPASTSKAPDDGEEAGGEGSELQDDSDIELLQVDHEEDEGFIDVTAAQQALRSNVVGAKRPPPESAGAAPAPKKPKPAEAPTRVAAKAHGVKLISATDAVLEDVACPLCSKTFERTSLASFNHHLDTCLTGKASKSKTRPDKKRKKSPPSKPSKPKDAFGALMKAARCK